MTKKEFVNTIQEKLCTDNLKQAGEVLDVIGEIITDALKSGDEIVLPEIGKFLVKEKAARKARNPKTGEVVNVPAKTVPVFKAAKALKGAVNGS